jgi:putative Mg2+ transporter-C (MgtC) family protein
MGFGELILSQMTHLDLTPFLVAILVGSAIGLEREVHGRPAGLRTHILVCLSATVLIHASRFASSSAVPGGLLDNLVYDPNRLGAGIVTGIGFLGAAAVIRSGDIVRGITTGACVWAVACLGVVIGQGHYAIALTGAFTMLIVLVIFDYLFVWVTPVVYRKLTVDAKDAEVEVVREATSTLLEKGRITIQDVSCHIRPNADTFDLTFHVRSRSKGHAVDLVAEVAKIPGVKMAEWGPIQQ